MARTLPWSGAGPSKPRPARNPVPKQSNAAATKSSTTGLRQTALHITAPAPAIPRKRRSSRTPSTSPPPGPPDTEPMIDGYHGDDIYIMVEDEFQTMAQSFTTHLHHAEYKRRRKQARDGPQKTLPEPSSPMTAETKQRLRRAALHQTQKEVLKDIARPLPTHNDEAEDEKVDDPWVGTSLAGLMTSSSQQKTSLVGLEKLAGTSRAAQGFAKIEPKARVQARSIIEEYGPSRGKSASPEDEEKVNSSANTLRRGAVRPFQSDKGPIAGGEQRASRANRDGTNGFERTFATRVETMESDGSDLSSPTRRRHLNSDARNSDQPFGQETKRPPAREDIQKLKSMTDKLASKRKFAQEEERKKKARLDEVPMFVL